MSLKFEKWTIGRDRKTRNFFVYRVVSDATESWIDFYINTNGDRWETRYCLTVQRKCHKLRGLCKPTHNFSDNQEIAS
jgi:hypothetical protein